MRPEDGTSVEQHGDASRAADAEPDLDPELGESAMRRRAAWLLGLLAVVAALVVVLAFAVYHPSSSDGRDRAGADDAYGNTSPTPSARSSSSAVHAAPAPPARSAARSAASSPAHTHPGTPSCPGRSTCTVAGDLGGALSAINDYRTAHHRSPVTATSTSTAQRCALSSGSDCPSSFVWVHVDGLTGPDVVAAVNRFHRSSRLLESGVTAFDIGWAYDPRTRTTYVAVVTDS